MEHVHDFKPIGFNVQDVPDYPKGTAKIIRVENKMMCDCGQIKEME